MRFFSSLSIFICLLFSISIANANPNIVIVDMQRILQDSAAAKDVREKIKKKRDTYQADITKQEDELRSAEKKLSDQRSILSPEAFEAKRKEFKERLVQVQHDVQKKRSNLDADLNKALDKIQTSVLEIITELSKERSFDVALPSSQVLFATKAMDLTSDVLTRLNKRLPKMKE